MDQKAIIRIASRVAAGIDPEGVPAVPDGEVIAHIQKIIAAKYAIEMAYRNFADRVRGPWRDALVGHWHEHAEDERKSTYAFSMKVVALGGDPFQENIQIPPCPANVLGFCKSLSTMEIGAIQANRELRIMAGDNTSLQLLAEEAILLDTHHLDDLKRMCVDVCQTV